MTYAYIHAHTHSYIMTLEISWNSVASLCSQIASGCLRSSWPPSASKIAWTSPRRRRGARRRRRRCCGRRRAPRCGARGRPWSSPRGWRRRGKLTLGACGAWAWVISLWLPMLIVFGAYGWLFMVISWSPWLMFWWLLVCIPNVPRPPWKPMLDLGNFPHRNDWGSV